MMNLLWITSAGNCSTLFHFLEYLLYITSGPAMWLVLMLRWCESSIYFFDSDPGWWPCASIWALVYMVVLMHIFAICFERDFKSKLLYLHINVHFSWFDNGGSCFALLYVCMVLVWLEPKEPTALPLVSWLPTWVCTG